MNRLAISMARAAPAMRTAAFRPTFCTVQTFLDKAEVSERVITVVKNFEKVDDSKVTAESNFTKDLGLDSLDQVELAMALEEEFCITIPDAESEKILSCTDAITFISTHPQAK